MRKSLLGETLVLSWLISVIDFDNDFESDKEYYYVCRDCTEEDITLFEQRINQLKDQPSVISWVLSRHIVSSDY